MACRALPISLATGKIPAAAYEPQITETKQMNNCFAVYSPCAINVPPYQNAKPIANRQRLGKPVEEGRLKEIPVITLFLLDKTFAI